MKVFESVCSYQLPEDAPGCTCFREVLRAAAITVWWVFSSRESGFQAVLATPVEGVSTTFALRGLPRPAGE